MNRSRLTFGRLEAALWCEVRCRRINQLSRRQRLNRCFCFGNGCRQCLTTLDSLRSFNLREKRLEFPGQLLQVLIERGVTPQCPFAIDKIRLLPANRRFDRVQCCNLGVVRQVDSVTGRVAKFQFGQCQNEVVLSFGELCRRDANALNLFPRAFDLHRHQPRIGKVALRVVGNRDPLDLAVVFRVSCDFNFETHRKPEPAADACELIVTSMQHNSRHIGRLSQCDLNPLDRIIRFRDRTVVTECWVFSDLLLFL